MSIFAFNGGGFYFINESLLCVDEGSANSTKVDSEDKGSAKLEVEVEVKVLKNTADPSRSEDEEG